MLCKLIRIYNFFINRKTATCIFQSIEQEEIHKNNAALYLSYLISILQKGKKQTQVFDLPNIFDVFSMFRSKNHFEAFFLHLHTANGT